MSTKEILNDVYSGTASLGKLMSLIGAIISSIIFVALIIGGIYILTKKNNKIKVTGVVTLINGDKNTICQQNCVLTVDFSYNNINYEKTINYNGNTVYYVGESLDLYINSDGSDVSLIEETPRYVGFILIGIGLFILIFSWVNYWLSKKFKVYGALQGVGDISGAIFRR
jgi:hypothetical protein